MIHVGENTWNLRIYITDLKVEKTLRVKGEKNIGGVMVELVDSGIFKYKNFHTKNIKTTQSPIFTIGVLCFANGMKKGSEILKYIIWCSEIFFCLLF